MSMMDKLAFIQIFLVKICRYFCSYQPLTGKLIETCTSHSHFCAHEKKIFRECFWLIEIFTSKMEGNCIMHEEYVWCQSFPSVFGVDTSINPTFHPKSLSFNNIYNGIIFPSLNHANRTPFIGQWIESTRSVQCHCAKPERHHCDVIRLRQNVTKKFRRNWHFIFIEMRSLVAYSRENFRIFFSGAFTKRFYVGRYCKYKEWVSYFPAFMGNELGWGSDKSSENGISHVPHPSYFPWTQKKRHSFLNWHF